MCVTLCCCEATACDGATRGLLLSDQGCRQHRGLLVVRQSLSHYSVLLADMTRVVHCMGLQIQSHQYASFLCG